MAGAPEYVPAVNPDTGSVTEINAEDVAHAQSQGWRPPSPEEWQAYQEAQKYQTTGQKAAAFAEGVGEGIAGPVIPGLERMAGVDPAGILARKEAHPGLNMAGQGVGFIAPLAATALTGGAAAPLAGEVAAANVASRVAAKTLPGLITRAGASAAERFAAKEGAGVLARAVPAAADFATQGALMAASNVATQAVLGDPKLSAESAVAEVALGAGLGGVLGFGGSATVHGLAAGLGKAGEKAVAFAASKADNPEAAKVLLSFKSDPVAWQAVHSLDAAGVSPNVLGSAVHADTVPLLLKNAEKVAALEAKYPGIAKDVLTRATPEEAARIIADGDSIILGHDAYNQAGQEFADRVTNAYQTVQGEVRKAWGVRSAEMEALASKASPEVASSQAGSIFDRVTAAADEIRLKPDEYAKSAAAELDDIAKGLVRDITEDPAETYRRLDKVKRQLQGLPDYTTEAGKLKARNTEKLLKDTARDVRLALEDEKVWGEAGKRQAEFNSAASALHDAERGIGAAKKAPSDSKIMVQAVDENGRTTYRANAKRVNEWMNAMGNGRSAVKSEGFADFLDAAEHFAAEMEKTGYTGGAALREQMALVRKEVQAAEKSASVTSLVERLKNPGKIRVSEGYIPTGAQLAGQAATSTVKSMPMVGSITGAIEGTITKIAQPSFAIGVMDAFGKATQRMSASIEGGIGRMFTGAASKAVSGGSEAAINASNYTKMASDIRAHASDPQMLADAQAKQTAPWSRHAPEAAAEATGVSARATQLLASKLPPETTPGPFGGEYKPSPAEFAAFNRTAAIIQNPSSILDKIARGTIHPDHIEALSTVYPALHKEMSMQIMDRMAQLTARGGKIPFQTRMGLALFLGGNLDPMLNPQSMQANQAAIRIAAQNENTGNVEPSARPGSNLGVAGRMATPMQASASRSA